MTEQAEIRIDTLEELVEAVEDCLDNEAAFSSDLGEIYISATPSERREGIYSFFTRFKDWTPCELTVSTDKTDLTRKNAPLIAMVLADDSRKDELDWGQLKGNPLYQSFKKAEKQLETWLQDEDGEPLQLGDIEVVFREENGLFLYRVTRFGEQRDYVDLEDTQALARRILLENIAWDKPEGLDLTAIYVPTKVREEIRAMAQNDKELWDLKRTETPAGMETLLEHVYKTFRLLGLCD